MQTVKTILFILAISLAGPLNAQARPSDDEGARVAAAERYFRLVPFREFMDDMAPEMAKQVPEDKRAEFIQFFTTEVRFEVIESAAKQSMAKHLKLAEIEALIEFMEKPEGKSAMSKMKFYMGDVMPVVQAEVQRALAAHRDRVGK